MPGPDRPPTPAPPPPGRPGAVWLRLLALAAVLVAAWLAARAAGLERLRDPGAILDQVRAFRGRPGVAPGFVAAYAVAAGLGLPGSPFTLAGGALFGTALGTLLNWIGATIGATIAYLIARALGRDAVRRLLGRHAGTLDRAVAGGGFVNLLRLRLVPIVPFNALNFGAGLAGVPLRSYVLATALGILPGTAVYTFFADALLAGAAGARREALVRVAVAGGLLVLLSFVPALARRLGWIAPAALLGASLAGGAGHLAAVPPPV